MKSVMLAIMAAGICFSLRADSLATTDGANYENITSKRADPDGLYIEYTLPGGGIGMAKVKFARLSDDLRKQYGYDAAKAKDYEAQSAKALDDWRTENAKMEQESRARRAEQLSQANQQTAMETERIAALAQLKAAEADLARAMSAGYGNYGGGGWGDAFAIPTTGRAQPARRDYAPIVPKVPFPVLNTPAPAHFGGNGGRR